MAEDVLIIGAGGQARVIADIVHLRGDRVLGFLDDRADNPHGLPLLGKVSEAASYMDKAAFIIGIGDGAVRERIAGGLRGHARFYTAVHPSAVVARGVALGEGTVVMALAAVNVGSQVGKHCILNTSCSVDHDCRIGDYTHVSPGAHLAGGVVVGMRCHLGTGAAVIPGITLCGGCVIGAGGVVIRDIAQPGTYAGVPARLLGGGA